MSRVVTCEEELAGGVSSQGGGANLAHRHPHLGGGGGLGLVRFGPRPAEGAARGWVGVLGPPHCF